MNNQQIEKIDIEIERLKNRRLEIKLFSDRNPIYIKELDVHYETRIAQLEWVKENI